LHCSISCAKVPTRRRPKPVSGSDPPERAA
jgi:hypothetical protein